MMYFWLRLNVLAFITNLCPFQHGHPGYLEHSRKRQVQMIQNILMNCIFLTSRLTKYAKRKQILDGCQSKLFGGNLPSFPFPHVVLAINYKGIH